MKGSGLRHESGDGAMRFGEIGERGLTKWCFLGKQDGLKMMCFGWRMFMSCHENREDEGQRLPKVDAGWLNGGLEEVERDPNVVALGLFGSMARRRKGFDADIFVLVKGEADEIRKKLFEAGFDAAVSKVGELGKIDPIFLAAVARSFRPIKGELNVNVDDYTIERELRSATIHHLMRFRDSLVGHEFRSALILNAFNAARYACWLLLYKGGRSFPCNSGEMLPLLRDVEANGLLKLLESSVLATVERDLDVGKAKLKKTSLLYAMLSVAEALRLAADPLKEAEEWVKHVETRSTNIDPRDAMSIRGLCQGLFMAIIQCDARLSNRQKGPCPRDPPWNLPCS